MKKAGLKNLFCRDAAPHLVARFPLTPALSLGEREKRSQFFGEATAEFSSVTHKFYKTIQRLFPLPEGEGQGEGERGKTISNRENLQ